ncbi:MAG: YidC/Oxa1 family membrane protein insertase [Anaeroplasma sp.]
MSNFFYKNRYKFLFIAFMCVILLGLTSCRMDSKNWYDKPYTSYGQEWVDLWNGGKGFWNTLWGWPVNLISYPIAWICSNIGKALGGSYFWGIFFTTIIVRTLAWPIYSKQNVMSLKMNLMQPELNKIQRKYQGRQDPRSQQMMQAEMMQLYKKYKVNPLGCITNMFLQFPIFMSMYEVVQRINATSTTTINGAVSVENSGIFALDNTKVFGFFEMNTSFFEATEIKDKIFALVVALLFGGLTLLQQKLGQKPPKYQKQRNTPQTKQQTDQQKQMKWMMIIMNVMFVIMSLSSTSLAIYWLIGAIYQIFQSQVGKKINEHQYYKMQEKNNL